MQLFTNVFLLSICVFGAFAVPRLVNNVAVAADSQVGFYRVFLAQMRSALIDTRSLSPSSTACANRYNNATSQVVDTLTNKTGICDDNANRTSTANSQSINATVTAVRDYQLQIERNIQLCKNETTNESFLNCTQAYFDTNLQLLDTSNSLAYQALSQSAANYSVLDIQRDNCISSAVNDAKIQSIQAANDYNHCIQVAKNQREMSSESGFSETQTKNGETNIAAESNNIPESFDASRIDEISLSSSSGLPRSTTSVPLASSSIQISERPRSTTNRPLASSSIQVGDLPRSTTRGPLAFSDASSVEGASVAARRSVSV